MPTSRIEIEHVNKNWVVQVEASSILRSDRKTVYAGTVEDALTQALAVHRQLEAKVRPQDEGKPRELTPELAEAVARFKSAADFHAEEEAEKAKDDAFREGSQWTPEQIANMEKNDIAAPVKGLSEIPVLPSESLELAKKIAPLSKDEVQISVPDGDIEITLPKRGRHRNDCTCEKCVAKRAA